MAVLADQDRHDLWAKWMTDNREPVSIDKHQLRAAFNALDDWLNTNAVAANNAIPQPARSALTTEQKARILSVVIKRRFIKGA